MKRIVGFVSAVLFAGVLRVIQPGPRRVVLFYHGVQEDQRPSFERQMAHLAAHYKVVRASEIRTASAADGVSLVALTFDDALISVANGAVPVMQRLGLVATICVPTANLGRPPVWEMADRCPERGDCVMTDQHVRHLDEQGFELFSHGASHSPLSQLSEAQIRSELAESKHRLEQILGHEIVGIGYPHGAYDQRVTQLAREVGYRVGFTTEPCLADRGGDELAIGRVSASPGDSLFAFRLKACGAYQALFHLSRGKRWLRGAFRRGQPRGQP